MQPTLTMELNVSGGDIDSSNLSEKEKLLTFSTHTSTYFTVFPFPNSHLFLFFFNILKAMPHSYMTWHSWHSFIMSNYLTQNRYVNMSYFCFRPRSSLTLSLLPCPFNSSLGMGSNLYLRLPWHNFRQRTFTFTVWPPKAQGDAVATIRYSVTCKSMFFVSKVNMLTNTILSRDVLH